MRTNNLFVYLFILLGCYLTINGCNNNPVNNSNTTYKTFSEPEFADPNLRAQYGSLIVVDLEHLNSPPRPGSFDTETTGIDAIPVRYDETKEYSFRLDESAKFEMKLLKDPLNEEVFILTPANSEITINIPAGNYILLFKSLKTYGSDATTTQTVFFRPNELRPGNTGGTDPLEQLITTGMCDSCEFRYTVFPPLENVSMRHATIYEGKFSSITYADMAWTKIENTDFNKINLSHVDLSNAHILNGTFVQVNFNRVNFNTASLHFSRFQGDAYIGAQFDSTVNFYRASFKQSSFAGAVFRHTNMQNANMSEGSFVEAQFYYADVSNSKFYKADLTSTLFQNAKAFGTDFCGCTHNYTLMSNVSINGETKCFIWPH